MESSRASETQWYLGAPRAIKSLVEIADGLSMCSARWLTSTSSLPERDGPERRGLLLCNDAPELRLVLDNIGEPLLESQRDALVAVLAARAKRGLISDFVREGVLESVFEIGKHADLVKKLRRLQLTEFASEILLPIDPAMAWSKSKREILADDRCRLKQLFRFEGEPVDAGGEHRLHRGGNLKLSIGLASR